MRAVRRERICCPNSVRLVLSLPDQTMAAISPLDSCSDLIALVDDKEDVEDELQMVLEGGYFTNVAVTSAQTPHFDVVNVSTCLR